MQFNFSILAVNYNSVYFLILLYLIVMPHQDYRQLILYAPAPIDATLKQQQKILATDSAGLKDRDIIVSVRTGRSHKTFSVHLIGKDGGEKYTSDKPVTLQKLYFIIDAMPMRKDEMKQKE